MKLEMHLTARNEIWVTQSQMVMAIMRMVAAQARGQTATVCRNKKGQRKCVAKQQRIVTAKPCKELQ